jgi:hypothetical protein
VNVFEKKEKKKERKKKEGKINYLHKNNFGNKSLDASSTEEKERARERERKRVEGS